MNYLPRFSKVFCLGLLINFAVEHVATAAPVLPAGVSQHASVEGITEYRLNNGLTILLFPDPSKPLITVNMTYRVGSKHENYGETGMAHLLEHLMFKGTPKLPNFAQSMQQRGMQWNGTTYYDRTNYYETFSASDDNLRWAIEMEADRMINSFISKKDLDSEMTVVRNELERGENSPFRVLSQRMMAAAFDWHNYAKPTIGAVSDLENVNITNLQAFYKKYYQVDNAVITIAGRFNPEQTLKWVVDSFGSIPKPQRVLPKLYTVEPTQDGERRVTVRRTGDATLWAVQYHVPGASHADAPALALLTSILGSEPSGKLYQTLNEPGLVANSYAWMNSLAERGVFIAGFSLEPKHSIQTAETALLKAIQSLKQDGSISLEALNRAKQELAAEHEQLLQRPQELAVALSESIGHGDWRLLFAQQEAIKNVSLKDIERVITHYLKAENSTIGQFIPTQKPDRAVIPQTPSASVVADAAKFNATVRSGEAFDPTPVLLESRTLRKTQSNGLQWAQLTKQNRGNALRLRIKLRWASTAQVNESQMHRAATWVGPMLQEGSKGLTKQQLTDTLNQLNSKLNISSGSLGAEIAIETTSEHALEVLKLLEVQLKQALFDNAAFERLRSAKLAELLSRASNPEKQAAAEIAAHTNRAYGLAPNDWRYNRNTLEQIEDLKALSISQIQKYYTEYWTSRFGMVSVVGTLPAGLEDAVNTRIGAWSASEIAAKRNYQRPSTEYIPVPALEKTLNTPDKANAVYLAQAMFALERSNPDYWPMQIASQILGGDQFNSRIGKRVRVQEGLSYSAYSYINVDTMDNRAAYIANASFAPQNKSKVQLAMREELAKLVQHGITEQELKDTQASLLQSLEQQRASDDYLSQHLVYQLETSQNFSLHQTHLERIQNATVAQVNDVIKRYLDPLSITEILAGDFKQ